MDYYGLNINAIVNRLQQENLTAPAGETKQEVQNQTVRVTGEFRDIQDIEELPLTTTAGTQIRLTDIAEVKLQYPDQDQIRRLSGSPSIGIFIQKQSDANIVKTTDNVKESLGVIEKGLPAEINVTVAADESEFINATLKAVMENLLEGIVTTSIVLFCFCANGVRRSLSWSQSRPP